MAKRSGPDPMNFLIDLAAAATMGVVARQKLKSDYAKGYGRESAIGAMAAFSRASMRSGGMGMIGLGGMLGVNSALKSIERQNQLQRLHHLISTPDYTLDRQRQLRLDEEYQRSTDFIRPYRSNDNRYAWRLNCPDGSAYGISPMDYETRDTYNLALEVAKLGQKVEKIQKEKQENPEESAPIDVTDCLLCKVSRLDNGENAVYVFDKVDIKVGDTVLVPTENGNVPAVVLSVEITDVTQIGE